MVPAHLRKAGAAGKTVKDIDKICQHDRTPLLITEWHIERLFFRAIFAASRKWFRGAHNGFRRTTKHETESRAA
jgi:hypothetical protein